jgi:abortive infection bacteriophage resistance protein
MDRSQFSKKPLKYEEQIELLKQRGIVIENEQKAIHILQTISYYRLSGYWYPFLEDKKNHNFKPNSTFESAFKLYCFDRKLRQLVISELEKIEVSIRAKMAYIMSNAYDPFWYRNDDLFTNQKLHENSLIKISEEYKRSDEEFIKAFKIKYSDDLPPSWMIFEITSFGALSLIFKNLKPSNEKREIAHYFGISDTVFQTWLHSIVYLRNICAHHTRLWNRSMSITPQIPRKTKYSWIETEGISNNKMYFNLSMIMYLLQTINPHNSFTIRLKELFTEFKNIDIKAMGFPVNWTEEPLWKR